MKIKWNEKIFVILWAIFCILGFLAYIIYDRTYNVYDINKLSDAIWSTRELNYFGYDEGYNMINEYSKIHSKNDVWELAWGLRGQEKTKGFPINLNSFDEVISFYNLKLDNISFLLKDYSYYIHAEIFSDYIIYGGAFETGKIYSKRPLNIENFKIEHNIYNMEQSKDNPHIYYWNGYKNHNPDYKIKLNEEDLFLGTAFTD